jgi:hypothetical protein
MPGPMATNEILTPSAQDDTCTLSVCSGTTRVPVLMTRLLYDPYNPVPSTQEWKSVRRPRWITDGGRPCPR